MRYILKIVVPSVPPYNHEAYGFAEDLVVASRGMPPASRLLQFYDAITARFPCASGGAYEDGKLGECPWGDTPLLAGFTGEVAVIAVSARNVEVIPFLLRRAGAFALTVVDEQAGKVHRPATFRVVLQAVSNDVITRDLATKLVPLLKRSDDEVLAILSRPQTVLKRRLDHVTAQRFAETLGLIGCICVVEKELGEGAVLVAPFTPPPVVRPADVAANTPHAEEPQDARTEQSGSWVTKVLSRVGRAHK